MELVFNRYKSDECLDKTNVQGDFSVIGAEFINFIATVLTYRLLRKARDSELMNHMSYSDLKDDLGTAWRMADGPSTLPASDDRYWVHTLNIVFEELEALGLSGAPPKPEPKKRGRQRRCVSLSQKSLSTQEDVQGKILSLPGLCSPADWET